MSAEGKLNLERFLFVLEERLGGEASKEIRGVKSSLNVVKVSSLGFHGNLDIFCIIFPLILPSPSSQFRHSAPQNERIVPQNSFQRDLAASWFVKFNRNSTKMRRKLIVFLVFAVTVVCRQMVSTNEGEVASFLSRVKSK
jgi:hypothetical protein